MISKFAQKREKRAFLAHFTLFAVFETKMPFFEVLAPTFSKKESEKTEKPPLTP
ncbi:MAG: hypothetical protein K5945_11765 [Bacteroidaceae bacterium]|nr:hypothetical protein [Bacteroidaceae bacterium]